MVAIAMSLLVVGACSVAVLQVGLQTDRVKRATTPRHIHRTPRPRPVRAPLRLAPSAVPAHRVRSSFVLMVFATGIGIALAAAVGLFALAVAVALRSAVGA